MIKRGQILVREIGRSSNSWGNGALTDPRTDYAMIGILEVPSVSYDQHWVRGFIGHEVDGHFCLIFTEFLRPLQLGGAQDLGSLATQSIWPRPHVVSQYGGGGLVLRNTRAPAANGRRIVFVLAVASLRPGALKHHHLYEVHGSAGYWPSTPDSNNPGCFELFNPTFVDGLDGEAFTNLLKKPLWGWEVEPYAFVSTLDLRSIDKVHEIQSLLDKPDRTPAEENQLAVLLRTDAGSVFSVSAREADYAEFRRQMNAEMGPLRWDAVLSASQLAQRDAVASRIVRSLLEPQA